MAFAMEILGTPIGSVEQAASHRNVPTYHRDHNLKVEGRAYLSDKRIEGSILRAKSPHIS